MAFAARLIHGEPKALTVSELTRLLNDLIEEHFDRVCVVGQISNFKIHSSGHAYFTLKDEEAQISCVMWKSHVRFLEFDPEDGLEAVAQGYIKVYPKQGRYQLYVEQLRPVGIGAMELRFRQLLEKLQKEGLFDRRHKKQLPRYPRKVCVITSPRGAAVRDIIRVITNRWPAAEVIVVPVLVQGDRAAEQIAAALDLTNRCQLGDVIIVGRGGGSKEDLWAFNEEVVARAIFRSSIPVVSAVGHEIDTTIADYVADQRAATPSNAAEIVVPDREDVQRLVEQLARRLAGLVQTRIQAASERLAGLERRPVLARPLDELVYERQQTVDRLLEQLKRATDDILREAQFTFERTCAVLRRLTPIAYVEHQERRCADLLARLIQAINFAIQQAHRKLELNHSRLDSMTPTQLIAQGRERCEQFARRLTRAQITRLDMANENVRRLCSQLDSLSPLRVLDRGYSLTFKQDGRTVVRSPDEVDIGERILTRLARGHIWSEVTEKGPHDSDPMRVAAHGTTED